MGNLNNWFPNVFWIKMKLAGQVALITGSGRGIGKATALALANEGANIVVNDIDEKLAKQTAEEIMKVGKRAIALKADVSKSDEVAGLVENSIREFGKIDILVNNAGVYPRAKLVEMSEKDLDNAINVNLKAVFLCTKAVLPHMIKQRSGKIICIASNFGILSAPGASAYAAAKAGVISFVKSIAKEVGQYGIRVNGISPGITWTDMIAQYFTMDRLQREIAPQIPLGRIGRPEDVAKVVVFLASDDADYITGQILGVDGGQILAGF